MNTLKETNAYKTIKKLGRRFKYSPFSKYNPVRILRKFLQKKYKQAIFKIALHKATPILVFQMGKVGSTSIYSALKNNYPGVVLHRHHIVDRDWRMHYILDWAKKGNPIKIITPIRDPISRNVSLFFHFTEKGNEHNCDISTYPVSKQVELFLDDSFPNEFVFPEYKSIMSQNQPLEWFDKNIEQYFHINVYNTPFPECGYTSFSHNNTDLLVYRIDISDTKKEQLIKSHINFSDFSLKNKNIGSLKSYANEYKAFQEQAKLPETYLKKMCESKYFKHFYTQVEIGNIKHKWTK
ncbi:MAG: putative capsular polysaccharide synthesis family protein [Gammaproteobacteria bacterium]|nr:putative capsular polysaccharide synthesis family protein [Gammaproteobacteria bacterium]